MDYTFWDLQKLNSEVFYIIEEKDVCENLSPEDKAFAEFWYGSNEQDQVNWWSPDINQENSVPTSNRF